MQLITARNVYTANPDQLQLQDAALVIDGTAIVWLGSEASLPAKYQTLEVSKHFATGWLSPGLIDCHTHLIYGGSRDDEFRRRLEGESYESIARSGGGIISTVNATRSSSEGQLLESAENRLLAWIKQGVTHIEIKSGYGLTLDDELKMLSVAQTLSNKLPIGISKTLLAAHALPPEYKDNPEYGGHEQAHEAYMDYVCQVILPAAQDKGLVDAVDAFCENIAFSTKQVERLFQQCKVHQLPVKLHAEQLSNQRGAEMAAHFQALSADHLEYLDQAGVKAMASSGTVAVLLPGAFYFLKETQLPPMQLLREYQVPMAVATDANPGTSPTNSLVLMLNMACTLFGLTPAEALQGVTINAAKALGIDATQGSLAKNKIANIMHWDVSSLETLCYQFGHQTPDWQMYQGKPR